MRNIRLYEALRRFARDAAAQLSAELEAGAELEFDVEAAIGGRGPTLYRYRPLTDRFIARAWPALRALPSATQAAESLREGAALYLEARGVADDDAEPALRALLERLYEDQTNFAFPEERFERVYAELEQSLYGDARPCLFVTCLRGVECLDRPVRLGARERLELLPPQLFERELPAELAGVAGAGAGNTVVCLELLVEGPVAPLEHQFRERLRELRLALRLLAEGRVDPFAIGFRRVADSRWVCFELDRPGPGRGEPLRIDDERAAELGELLAVVRGRAREPRLELALERFDRGCAAADPQVALLDLLCALRALLAEHTDTDRASLGLRVAALCADVPDRPRVRRDVERALSLERSLLAGPVTAHGSDVEAVAQVVRELERHVRALLRDVLCGYLELDLARVADEMLLRATGEVEIAARDLRVAKPRAETSQAGASGAASEDETDPVGLAAVPPTSASQPFDDPDDYSAPV